MTCNRGGGGTPGYMPPEVYDERRWYPRGDVFSLGVVFFQLMVGQSHCDPVLGGNHLSNSAWWAARCRQLPWHRFPDMPDLKNLVGCMTRRERTERPRPVEALVHPWFRSREDAQLPEASLRGLLGPAAALALRRRGPDLALHAPLRFGSPEHDDGEGEWWTDESAHGAPVGGPVLLGGCRGAALGGAKPERKTLLGGAPAWGALGGDHAAAPGGAGPEGRKTLGWPELSPSSSTECPSLSSREFASLASQQAPASSVRVRLDRGTADQLLGLTVDAASDGSLKLLGVEPFGLLASWNRSNFAASLQAGDHIVAVNGVSGDVDAMCRERAARCRHREAAAQSRASTPSQRTARRPWARGPGARSMT
ncbi:unnamed protein product [Prorocentrum cordatum]|uniref:Protein kinase domain-containing protein n=1 Tax=Prorocentrum cordatum TaxID=2364126 RepID=A0ABN9ULZ9_9DINO|nr:unnamed protein product [Polarella glacialis]